jgi:hypothetical protein
LLSNNSFSVNITKSCRANMTKLLTLLLKIDLFAFFFAIYSSLGSKDITQHNGILSWFLRTLLLRQEYQEYLLEPSRCGKECFMVAIKQRLGLFDRGKRSIGSSHLDCEALSSWMMCSNKCAY